MRKYSSVRLRLSYILIIAAAVVLFTVILVLTAFDRKLRTIVTDAAAQQTSEIIYDELDGFLKEKGDMGELIHISYDDEGVITGITTDSVRINAINSELGSRISKALNSIKDNKTSVPVGALSGIDVLSGKGFDIDVYYHNISDVKTELVSTFESCGINQTKHCLKLLIKAEINAVMPGKDINIEVSQEFLISETVIVGKIPGVYLNND